MDPFLTTAPDEGQDLIYGEEHHVTREFVREHGVVATPADARYEFVIRFLPQFGQVKSFS
jgi:hypothetical protein